MSRLCKITAVLACAALWLAMPNPVQAAELRPPTAPGTPVFSNVTEFSVTLTWAPSADDVAVTNYLVRRGLLNGQTWTESTPGTVNTITIRDLTPNQSYTFTVLAVDADANTTPSTPATVRTLSYTAGPMCSIRYQANSSGGSFSATVDLTNLSTGPWQEWTLGFTLAAHQRINPEWGYQQNGNRWTGSFVWLWSSGAGPLLPNRTRSVFFSGSYLGAENPTPTQFTINDHPCTATGPLVPPGQPQNLVITSLTPGAVGVQWSVATPGTNPIRSYEVLVNGYRYPCAGVDPMACSISGLTPDTAYVISVRAVDSTGLVGPAASVTLRTPPATPPGCDVAYSINDWRPGFTAAVRITNTGSTTISSWTLRFTFTAGQRLTQSWNATWSQPAGSAEVSATGYGWSASIPPGASVSIGFNGTYISVNPEPVSFTLNGNACTVS